MKKILVVILVLGIVFLAFRFFSPSRDKNPMYTEPPNVHISPKAYDKNTSRPYLGIRYKMIDESTAKSDGLVPGAYVVSVIKNTPADGSLVEEDIIVSLGAVKTAGMTPDALSQTLSRFPPGEPITLEIYRNHEFISLEVTPESPPNL